MLFFIQLKSTWIDIFASLLRKALITLFQQKPFYQKKKKKKELIKKKKKERKRNSVFSFGKAE